VVAVAVCEKSRRGLRYGVQEKDAMSIAVMSAVWEHSKQRGVPLLLLLAISDHANEDGVAWPGIDLLARKCRSDSRYMRRLLQNLERSGELYISHNTGRGNTNEYLVAVARSENHIRTTLVKRLDVEPEKAARIAAYLTGKEGIQYPLFTETKEGTGCTEKEGTRCTKGGTGSTKEGTEYPGNHHEPSEEPSEEPSHDNGDPDEETLAWIADLEGQRTPPPDRPKDAGEFLERLRETEGKMLARLSTEPYLTWGMQSQQAQDDLAGMLEAEKVQWLGYELEQAHNLIPLWTDRKAVTSWLTGLQKCVAASRGTPRLAMQAAKRLRDKEMTVASPWSLVKTTQAIWAENQSARGGNGDGWSKDELTQAAEEAARELGE